jgi:hypothetical protein
VVFQWVGVPVGGCNAMIYLACILLLTGVWQASIAFYISRFEAIKIMKGSVEFK